MPTIQPLTTLEQFHQVEQLETAIWGPDGVVPVTILAVTVRRGAVLLGAYDAARLIGFVDSLAALRPPGGGELAPDSDGLPVVSHWSHLLAVAPDCRGRGLGAELKLAQREAVSKLGLDLIEWTYDPLQSVNAHLNFTKLGVIVEDYVENVYGESTSTLHGGLPTDRFICQWWIQRPHVLRRIAPAAIRAIDEAAARAPVVNRTEIVGESQAPAGFDADCSEPRVKVEIPLDFQRMLTANASLALQWRLEARAIFEGYLARGYRVVDFAHDRAQNRGQYLLTTIRPELQ
jgi:predicted GNAT superfamily acetyltransferase